MKDAGRAHVAEEFGYGVLGYARHARGGADAVALSDCSNQVRSLVGCHLINRGKLHTPPLLYLTAQAISRGKMPLCQDFFVDTAIALCLQWRG